jgi:coenzyme F420 biosynthesis associated uncharacterized protein
MIDWGVAERVAGLLAGGSRPLVGNSPESPKLPDDIAERARASATRISEYTGLTVGGDLPPPEGVDRPAWISANLRSMRPMIEPLVERVGGGLGALGGPLRSATGLLLGAQVGALVGMLSQRVLGQYDMVLLDADSPRRLLLVTPNLADAADTMDVDYDELVTWVTVHEVTHAVQFTGAPWLRGHLAALLTELMNSLEVSISPQALRMPDRDGLRALADAARRGDLLRIIVGPERHALVERIQSAMSLVEGHAEHVMDAVGADVLPSLPRLRAALTRRRAERPPFWRLLERLLGLDLKMRQYEVGKRFCDRVVELGGPEALERAWASPEALPTAAELEDPAAWLKRTNVPAVTKSAS